jgi:NADH-quinone oxidoreductase subunit M
VHRWFAVVAAFGIVLAAVYALWMVQRTIHGPVREGIGTFRDLNRREAWVIAPIVFVLIALGVYPKPLLDVINPSVKSTFSTVRPADPHPSQALPVSNGGSK